MVSTLGQQVVLVHSGCLWFYVCVDCCLFLTGYELDTSDIGLVDEEGPTDLQPFLVAFFRAPQKLQPKVSAVSTSPRKRRSVSEKSKREDVSYAKDSDYVFGLNSKFSVMFNTSDLS